MMNVFKTLTNGILEKAKTFKGDWNENDSSSPNYIKNRPFYEDPNEEIIEKVMVQYTGHFTPWNDYTPDFKLILGKDYIVTVDGVKYTRKCVLDNYGDMVLGSFSVGEEQYDGTGDPFYIYYHPEGIYSGVCIEPPGKHSVSIDREIASGIHKIDEKYLPELTKSWNDLEDKPFGEVNGEIITLDEKYLPDTIATKTYVDEVLGVIENGTY